MKNIKIVTSIAPNKQNIGGPSGLIWECIEIFKAQNIDYTIDIIENKSFLNKLGIYFKKYSEIDKSDMILVYPFNLFYCLDNELKKKAVILGPDSPSLLFERFYRNSIDFKTKIRNFILKNWFVYKEKRLLQNADKFLVVGKNDTRWLKRLHLKYSNIYYLTHPILQSILEDKNNCLNSNYKKKSIIFAGDMSQKYTNKYINDFATILEQIELDILIVGKNNKWVYDLFLSHSSKKNISYIEWIENYAEICNPNFHVHIIPLTSGAGTKNRTLTACAMGVTIISTAIGLENILYGQPVNKIFKFNRVADVVALLKSEAIFDRLAVNTDNYIENVNIRFKKEFLKVLGLQE